MLNYVKLVTLAAIFIFATTNTDAQTCTELEAAGGGSNILSALFGGKEIDIEDVCRLDVGKDSYTVRAQTTGTDWKKYHVIAQLLDKDRKPIPGWAHSAGTMEGGSALTDLTISFDQSLVPEGTALNEVRYVRVTVVQDDGQNVTGAGGFVIKGKSVDMHVNHEFGVSGTAPVAISLTPVGPNLQY